MPHIVQKKDWLYPSVELLFSDATHCKKKISYFFPKFGPSVYEANHVGFDLYKICVSMAATRPFKYMPWDHLTNLNSPEVIILISMWGGLKK